MLQERDIVNIYVDPFGKTMLEGKAMLIKRVAKYEEYERWTVNFLDFLEYARCVRNICAPCLLLALLHATAHNNSYQTLVS